jgi:two-component system cell cycle response regulator
MLDPSIEQQEAALDAEAEVERILAELRDALQRIRSLGTLINVCGSCKDIREAGGEWRPMEHFLAERLGVSFSHGLCPNCGRRLLEDLERSGSKRG